MKNSKLILIVIGVILFLSVLSQLFGNESEDAVAETDDIGTEPESVIETTTTADIVPPEAKPDISAAINGLKDILKTLDYEYLSIDHTEEDGLHFFNIKRNAPEGTAVGLILYYKSDATFKESWDILIESDKNVSKELSDFLIDKGYENVFVCIYLLSDANQENTLYTVMNGITFYNVVDDLE